MFTYFAHSAKEFGKPMYWICESALQHVNTGLKIETTFRISESRFFNK